MCGNRSPPRPGSRPAPATARRTPSPPGGDRKQRERHTRSLPSPLRGGSPAPPSYFRLSADAQVRAKAAMRSKHKHQESMQLAAITGGNHDHTLTMANGKYDRFLVMRLPTAGSEVDATARH